MFMQDTLAIFYLLSTLAILALGLIHILPSYSLQTIIKPVKAAETDEKRAHEQVGNLQNGFSPIGSELSKQMANKSKGVISNLSPQSLIQAGSPIQGKLSAPITIVEFGDFQCGFCARFAKETEPKINETYIQNGKVNMIFKNFVTHGPDSYTAAIAAQCANDQGKFWNFYDALYKNQGGENTGWADVDNLKKISLQISGLNTQKFNTCLDSTKYKSLGDTDNALAISSGFQGTPTFVIEKRDGTDIETLLGAYPFPSFQAIIDKKLNE